MIFYRSRLRPPSPLSFYGLRIYYYFFVLLLDLNLSAFCSCEETIALLSFEVFDLIPESAEIPDLPDIIGLLPLSCELLNSRRLTMFCWMVAI